MQREELIREIESLGAYRAAWVEGDQIALSASFRTLCEQNSCGVYGKCWVCPPACGEIEALMARVRSYPGGILYQTVGRLEDSFDIEGMIAARRTHEALSRKIEEALWEEFGPGRLHLSVGGCTLCEKCTYPEGLPCRFPEKALLSLEACGVDVYQTTKDTPLKYINGQNTVTYFGLILYGQEHPWPL